jgi:hypothetical protein
MEDLMEDNKELMDKELSEEEANAMIKEGNEFINSLKKDVEEAGIDIDNINVASDDEEILVKNMNTLYDPDTNEHKILGSNLESYIEKDKNEVFESIVNKINDSNEDEDPFIGDSPLSEKDITDYINNEDTVIDNNISLDAIRELLELINKKGSNENIKFTYKELPDELKTMIDRYMHDNDTGVDNIMDVMRIKNSITDALITNFVYELRVNKAKNDIARDLEDLYKATNKDISDDVMNYMYERNNSYREAANNIEDEDKRNKLLAILDSIDEAKNLTQLKEYSKSCKIKAIELDKPDARCYSAFLNKYKDSTNNIYDIHLAINSLYSVISKDGYTMKDVNAFFIAFCKQTSNYSVKVAVEHTYMYYVLYYCAFLSSVYCAEYIDNIKEVINNLRVRNPILTK